MKNWRTVAGALCIVAAMVFGAFAGIRYAASSGVSVSPDQGTRGEDRHLVSAFDENQKVMTAPEAEALASHSSGLSLLESQPATVSSSGITVKPVTQEQLKEALQAGGTVTYHGEHGDISMRTATPDETTRSHLIGFGTYTFANRITAKANVKVTELGHYHYAYNLFETAIFSGTGTLLGQCTAVHVTFQWNWCTLATPVNLVTGSEYVIGVRTTSYGNLISAASDSAKVHYNGLYYCFSSSLCYPS